MNQPTIRTINEILIEADNTDSLQGLSSLWNEIVLNKYKYPLVNIWFAQDHINGLKEKFHTEAYNARIK
jgi:hypothetical protein